MAGSTENTKHLAIQCELVDSSRVAVRNKHHLARAGSYTKRPRGAIKLSLVHRGRRFSGRRYLSWRLSHPWANAVIVRHVDVYLAQVFPVAVKHLYAPIAA